MCWATLPPNGHGAESSRVSRALLRSAASSTPRAGRDEAVDRVAAAVRRELGALPPEVQLPEESSPTHGAIRKEP